ncbi:MAG: hypothetical protein O7A69_05485, partial [SAR324 cluster bacterium]|nr:hypothetical protein [SAR324 cluster bacterium]
MWIVIMRWMLVFVLASAAGSAVYVLWNKERLAQNFYLRGNELAAEGALRSALGGYTMAILLDPDAIDPYLARARANRELQMPRRAIADLNHAIALAPDNPDFYFLRASISAGLLRDPRRAIRDFDRIIQLAPN